MCLYSVGGVFKLSPGFGFGKSGSVLTCPDHSVLHVFLTVLVGVAQLSGWT